VALSEIKLYSQARTGRTDSQEEVYEFGERPQDLRLQVNQALSILRSEIDNQVIGVTAFGIAQREPIANNIFRVFAQPTGSSAGSVAVEAHPYLGIASNDRSAAVPIGPIIWLMYGTALALVGSSDYAARGALQSKILPLFGAAIEERFEDGRETLFSNSLESLIRKEGTLALEIISDLLSNDRLHPEVAAEALRWIGHMEHDPTYDSRFALLGQALLNPSPQIRDGAALGLDFMEDASAIPLLQEAIERERIAALRSNLEQVLDELEKIGHASRAKSSKGS